MRKKVHTFILGRSVVLFSIAGMRNMGKQTILMLKLTIKENTKTKNELL